MIRLVPCDLFHTPANSDELWEWIDRLPTRDGFRLTSYTAAMMAWNLAAKIVREDLIDQTNELELDDGEVRS